jgi:hypothetical protein
MVSESGVKGVMLLLSLLVLGGGNAVLARDLATDLSGAFCPAGGITSVSAPVGMRDSTITLVPAVVEAASLEFKAANHRVVSGSWLMCPITKERESGGSGGKRRRVHQ